MEEIKVLTRDNVASKLTELLRMEIKSKKLHKLPIGFYDSFRKVAVSFDSEAEDALERQDITAYIKLKEQKLELEKDFKVFFQRRWEKISTYALYDIDQETLSVLSSPEKAAILEFKAVYAKYFGQFMEGEQ